MNGLRSKFLTSFAAAFAVCFVVIHVAWMGRLHRLPPRPPFPAQAGNYLAAYGDGGYVVHDLYRFGLFGMRERMQRADAFILGPSHAELGLSAHQLSHDLSAALGRSVHVYNLGIGYGDSLPFDLHVFAANGIRDKPVIMELYLPNGGRTSAFAQKVEKRSRLQAFLAVLELWVHADTDWMLDPWLPRIRLLVPDAPALHIRAERMLASFITRGWETGDVGRIWQPKAGEIYQNPPPAWNRPYLGIDSNHYDHTHDSELSEAMRAGLAQRGFRVIYTLVPFNGYTAMPLSPDAKPFAAIAPEGLTYIDSNHLNGAGRTLATERLFESLRDHHLIQDWWQPR